MYVLKNLWADETGFVVSTELVLVCSLIVAGLGAGMNALRGQMVQEMQSLGTSISSLNQSYSYSGVRSPGSYTAGSQYVDQPGCTQTLGNN